MELSIARLLIAASENMHFAKVQELSGEGSIYYRMLSEYGSGSFQLIRFENDLLMILIADYTPKETFEKIANHFRRIYGDQLNLKPTAVLLKSESEKPSPSVRGFTAM
ncbi:MAG: hypothetical protein ACLTQL_11250 [Eisenbergiella sp.]